MKESHAGFRAAGLPRLDEPRPKALVPQIHLIRS
jgi:hypothetical protein